MTISVRQLSAATCKVVADAEDVLRSFNTWAFKREHPSEPELLLQFIARRASRALPLQMILYWGKGPRRHVEQPEIACLEYLTTMRQRIAGVYPPGVEFVLCETDTHARLNGHDEGSITSYFGEIAAAAAAFSMTTVRLSELVDALPASTHPPGSPTALIEELERCAMKWFRGGEDAREGARRYLEMNMLESRAVETRFPEAIFVTFSSSRLRDMFPRNLPVFYMYSLRRGFSSKPWFLDAAGQSYPGEGPHE